MTALERDYVYVAKTFDTPGLDRQAFVDALSPLVLDVWRRLRDNGDVLSVTTFEKRGDIPMQTSSDGVRDWKYFVLLELAAEVPAQQVLDAEWEAGLTVSALQRLGVEYLSNEVLVRPAHAGTAIPVPSEHWPTPPPNQTAGIEYIYIPEPHWEEYRQFMKQVMGPVGVEMVRLGHSHQVQIMERRHLLHHHASLPAWNRIHILWGDFDVRQGGFIQRSGEVLRGSGRFNDVDSALNQASGYRIKPRMSKSARLEALCLDPKLV